jgi:triosephosphate isomerase (TIM)
VFFETKGSYTGEVSAPMLASIGTEYVIVGHSERRARGENNEIVNRKVRVALLEGIDVVLCIGEEARDHGGEYLLFLTEELISALSGLKKDSLKHIAIAYEPIWAIGKTSKDAMKPSDMHEMSLFIRKILTDRYDRATALSVPILYGGSVEVENSETLLRGGEIDGFLVGHASLDPESFKEILALASAL